ncbi:WD40-repeat-containing domain protein [Trametes meyenii]|nr:WD40-repeat-containing domain protein [Trametes meyenii]
MSISEALLKYQKTTTLRRHTEGVLAIAFSHDASYLATAGSDRKVCIWKVTGGVLLHSLSMTEPILSLVWYPNDSSSLLCGSQDGSLIIVWVRTDSVVINGTWAHACPVERLAVKGSPGAGQHVSSGAHHELFIWTIEGGILEKWLHDHILCKPADDLYSKDRAIIVTSIHWLARSPKLIVTYMHHGIVIFDSLDWTVLQAFPLNTTMQVSALLNASVRPDGSTIALSNAHTGFDVYNLQKGVPEASLGSDMGQRRTIPVLFIHGGNALLGGSTTGVIPLWDVVNQCRHHTLVLEGVCFLSTRISLTSA